MSGKTTLDAHQRDKSAVIITVKDGKFKCGDRHPVSRHAHGRSWFRDAHSVTDFSSNCSAGLWSHLRPHRPGLRWFMACFGSSTSRTATCS